MTPDRLVHVLIAEGIRDPLVLQAFREVPREAFVPPEFRELAYADRPIPIPHGQVTTQPSLIAKMLEALRLQPHERVLEIGTGYGFQTAVLARLAQFVWSIERHPDLAETAKQNLARAGITNVELVVGDGTLGLAEHAPYDAIVVSAAFLDVPQPLADHLRVGGRLVQPLGPGGDDEVVSFEKTEYGLVRREHLTWARFVRLFGRYGFRPE
ncbi:MAG: protein-L-isoaspartate(D-aspartate) O-methyltransferase [Armatimonadota bacterium]|nr:protein-L-isoaspartate(D-aspartate) O-methyltransferase [Armatimonadota bacterium]